jgi:hypothetical protein
MNLQFVVLIHFFVVVMYFWDMVGKTLWLNKKKIIRSFPTKLLTNIMLSFYDESRLTVVIPLTVITAAPCEISTFF